MPWIQDNIAENLTKFLNQIEKYEHKDDFRVGYEARQVSITEVCYPFNIIMMLYVLIGLVVNI